LDLLRDLKLDDLGVRQNQSGHVDLTLSIGLHSEQMGRGRQGETLEFC